MLIAKMSLQWSDFNIYDDTTPLFVPLTERQQAVLLALSLIVLDRRLWEPLADSEWDDIESWLAGLYGEVT